MEERERKICEREKRSKERKDVMCDSNSIADWSGGWRSGRFLWRRESERSEKGKKKEMNTQKEWVSEKERERVRPKDPRDGQGMMDDFSLAPSF